MLDKATIHCLTFIYLNLNRLYEDVNFNYQAHKLYIQLGSFGKL